ncbi:hypothetical protein [Streptomyces sp. NPDC058142]|uniref:hypothetical protein n=1 Tax=Streptomyces sp. NPDC058142 TaxID=3346355 RepID=UPI0036E83F75
MGKALERYESLRAFGGHAWDLDAIPPGRLQALVRFAKAARAQTVSDLRGDRRLATLVAFAAVMPQLAADEAIEVFDPALTPRSPRRRHSRGAPLLLHALHRPVR